MLLFVLLLVLFCIGNARRAMVIGLSPVPWIIYTILGFFAGLFIASFLVVLRNPELMKFAETNDQAGMQHYMLKHMSGYLFPLYTALFFAGGTGGYLLVRYLLERKRPGTGD